MDDSASFGYWVRRRRRALDLTQHELAQRAGYAVTTIRKIETDARRPSRQMAERLAQCLEIPPDERQAFVKAARAELPVDRMPPPTQSVAATLPSEQPVVPAPTHTHTPPPAPERGPTNLTVPPTSLIGREQDVLAVCATLRDPEVRLLTLTGAPGIGKSRLGLQAAAELLDTFDDGVFAIDLTTADDPATLAAAIGQAMALHDHDSQPPIERLKQALRQRRLLLVLDNFDRLVPQAPLVIELLAAPGPTILVTSRSALRVSGEHEILVSPLPLPPLDPLPALAQLAENPAVALFNARARLVKADFRLTPANAAAVALICVRLDGLPLAIELAAARSKLFHPQAMAARLQQRLGLLTDGARDLPPHQRTLRSAIGWSYELLSAPEQRLLARLGVFVGGFTISAVEVLGIAGEALFALEGLATLLDKSLLQQGAGSDGEPRFAMLETIREYALEQLEAHGEVQAVRRQHALFFLALAEAAEVQAQGAGQLPAVEQLREEHDNLRAALHWALEQGDAEIAVRLSGALGWFWDTRSYLSEGRRWLAAALAESSSVDARFRAKALASAGLLASDQNDFTAAESFLHQGLALYQECGDQRGLAYVLSYQGRMLRYQGHYAAAQACLAESRAIFEQLGDTHGSAYACYNLGRVLYQQGDNEEAHQLFSKSLARFQQIGDSWGLALVSCNLGRLYERRGDYPAAHARYAQSLALFSQIGDRWGQAFAHCKLGWILYRQGDAAAEAAFAASLTAFQQMQYSEGIADALAGMASLAFQQQRWERAVQLFGAAVRMRATVGDVLLTTDQGDDERLLAELRARLDAAAFDAAWNLPLATTLAQTATDTSN